MILLEILNSDGSIRSAHVLSVNDIENDRIIETAFTRFSILSICGRGNTVAKDTVFNTY